MAARRTLANRERDYEALELRRRGLTHRQISDHLGWKSHVSAAHAITRALNELNTETAGEVLRIEDARLDDMVRRLQSVFATPHYIVTPGGKIACHPDTGEPLRDTGPIVAAVLALLRVSESRRKLHGTDAPARTRVEVVTEDMVDAEIARLVALHGVMAGQHADTGTGAA